MWDPCCHLSPNHRSDNSSSPRSPVNPANTSCVPLPWFSHTAHRWFSISPAVRRRGGVACAVPGPHWLRGRAPASDWPARPGSESERSKRFAKWTGVTELKILMGGFWGVRDLWSKIIWLIYKNAVFRFFYIFIYLNQT